MSNPRDASEAPAPVSTASEILDVLRIIRNETSRDEDEPHKFMSLDPAKVLERLGLHDDACRALIKGAMNRCERHGFTEAHGFLALALAAVPRV